VRYTEILAKAYLIQIYFSVFQKLGDNSRFVDGAKYWNVFGFNVDAKNPPKPELRIHVRLYYSTVGKPLDYCQSPYELIECILHAIIGM
jgi:hypothetical protein